MSHITAFTAHLRRVNKHNLTTFRRSPLSEISGSFGDLGTFLPIVLALSSNNGTPYQISLRTTLIFTGLYNIITGLLFGIPLPVQPMKAIAAIAIANNLTRGEIMAAGIFVSGCIAFLSVTGLLKFANRHVPVPVVKGIQIGAGLSLVIPAGSKALAKLTWSGMDGNLMLIVAFLLLFMSAMVQRVPYALIVVIVGMGYAVVQSGKAPPMLDNPTTLLPHGHEWVKGILEAGLGQLPLTTLNSVIAVVALAGDLIQDVPTPNVTSIGLSVAAMNLIGCWFGCLPVCHGSGGLAAQYRFGARSGASIIFLGLLKLIMGLAFGDMLTTYLDKFPISFLTVIVVAAGIELAMVGKDLNDPSRASDLKAEKRTSEDVSDQEAHHRHTVMMTTAAMLLAFKNDGIGFTSGMTYHYIGKAFAYMEARRSLSRTEEQQPLLSEA